MRAILWLRARFHTQSSKKEATLQPLARALAATRHRDAGYRHVVVELEATSGCTQLRKDVVGGAWRHRQRTIGSKGKRVAYLTQRPTLLQQFGYLQAPEGV